MKAKQKGLQKLTESEIRLNEIFALEQITVIDMKKLTPNDLNGFYAILAKMINELKGIERDNFIKKVELFLDNDTKNQLWEGNHNSITYAISTLMQEFGRMPSKNEIADRSGLSRQTIYKHLNEYANHPQYVQQIEQFRFMTSKVLAKVFQFAVNGDMSAAKLYFNVTGNMPGQYSNTTLIQNQNNYIQLNGMVLNQQTIKRLNPDQLSTIETILKTALTQSTNLEIETKKNDEFINKVDN